MFRKILHSAIVRKFAIEAALSSPTHLPRNPLSEDVYIASFPKSGNTWARTLLAHALNEAAGSPVLVNWSTIQHIVPDIHCSRDLPERSTFHSKLLVPRILKSHCRGNKEYLRAIVIFRNPLDTLLSFHTYRQRSGRKESLSEFLRSQDGVANWVGYHNSWLSQRQDGQIVKYFDYESLKNNTESVLQTWAEFIGFRLEDSALAKAVEQSSAQLMKRSESAFSSDNLKQLNLRSFVGTDLSRKERYVEGPSQDDEDYVNEETDKTLRTLQDISTNVS